VQFPHTEQCEAINEQFVALEDQLEVIEDDFKETYVDYLDPHELELVSEKDKEVHEDIPDKSMDKLVIHLQEVQEFEFGNIEYLDNSSPDLPPMEPISLEDNIENLEQNSMMVPVICSSSASQPEDELMQNYVCYRAVCILGLRL
jgi:hypothetical protein